MLVFHEGANKHNSESIYASLPEQERARVLAQIILWKNRLESHPETEHVFSVTVTPENTDRSPITIQAHRYFNKVSSTQSWIVVALDSQNQVLGIKNTLVRNNSSLHMLEAEANIEVLTRKQGVASALGASNTLIFQQEFKENPSATELKFVAYDANITRLQKNILELDQLRALNAPQEKITALENVIHEAEAQRESWLNLYGDGGKLGFTEEDELLVKHISPNEDISLPGLSITHSDSNQNIVDVLNETIIKLADSTLN